MPQTRTLCAAVLAFGTFGSLIATGAYAWYLRSDAYRNSCAVRLSASLQMPSDIGRVVPRCWSSRQFEEIRVWLPGKRDEAADIRTALVRYLKDPQEPEAYELILTGGACEISTRTWLREDYRFVVESGLKPGFAADGPQRVLFSGIDLSFERDRFRAMLRNAEGVIQFDSETAGTATIQCSDFNGRHTDQPVLLSAAFSPREGGIRIDELVLTVPELPLAIVGLRDLAAVDIHSGSFYGKLLYSESDSGRCVSVSGRCAELLLSECTEGILERPWRGRCPQVELEELTFNDRVPERLRFRGRLTDMQLGDILALWGLGDVGGALELDVRQAEASANGIERFIASGRCENVDLEKLTSELGYGAMSGAARLTIDDLTIIDNRLVSFEATLAVADSDASPNWIERSLLDELARRFLNLRIPAFIPDRIEYTRLGASAKVTDEVLYLFGTHGRGNKTILTVRAPGGLDVPLIGEPAGAFELTSGLDPLRERALGLLRDRLAAIRAAVNGAAPPDAAAR